MNPSWSHTRITPWPAGSFTMPTSLQLFRLPSFMACWRSARERCLAPEGGLLVAGDAGDRDLRPEDVGVCVPVHVGAWLDLRQHLTRHPAEQLEHLVVPLELEDVVEHGARGVRVVGNVRPATGELVDQPGVYGAHGDLAVLRPLPQTLYVVQEPVHLGAGEVRIYDEAGLIRNHIV